MYLRTGALVALSFVATIFLFSPAEAQLNCVRYASQEDVDRIKTLTGSTIGVGACIDRTMSQTLGLDTGAPEALKYLESKVCPGFKVGYDASIPPAVLKETHVYFTAGQHGMDAKFMQCAARFIEAAEKEGYQPCITAALRSQAHQQASCMDASNDTVCGRTNRNPVQCRSDFSTCPHVNGRGMDLRSQLDPPKQTAWISKIVTLANSGRYGVKMGVANAYDPWHMEPVGGDCLGSVSAPPPLDQRSLMTAAPSSPLSTAARGMFGMPQQPQPQLPPQPLAQQQPILNSFAQPQLTNQLIPTNTQTNTSSQTSSTTNTNTNTNQNQNTNTLSVADRLLELAYGTSSSPKTSTNMATTVPLIITAANSGSIASTQGSTSSSQSGLVPGGLPSAQHTFVSPDLNANVSAPVGTQKTALLIQLYTLLRDVLLQVLQYLRPFSISNSIEAQKQQQLFGY